VAPAVIRVPLRRLVASLALASLPAPVTLAKARRAARRLGAPRRLAVLPAPVRYAEGGPPLR